jgi:hypothetical protein
MAASAPGHNEIDVVVLGPGFGESILLHIGGNDWVVVDSCVDKSSGRAAALVYLEQIGVNASTAVKLILASHWHDDHIGGISEVLEVCRNAQFACSAALTRKEFLQTACVFSENRTIKGFSGTSELVNVFSILCRRNQHPKRAIADRPIFTSGDCKVTALSPSDIEFDRFLAAIVQVQPAPGTTKFRLLDPKPNDLSVVLWVRVAQINILLGRPDRGERGALLRRIDCLPDLRQAAAETPNFVGHRLRVAAEFCDHRVAALLFLPPMPPGGLEKALCDRGHRITPSVHEKSLRNIP